MRSEGLRASWIALLTAAKTRESSVMEGCLERRCSCALRVGETELARELASNEGGPSESVGGATRLAEVLRPPSCACWTSSPQSSRAVPVEEDTDDEK